MIPIRDHAKTSTFPIITNLLIGVNVAVFFYMLTLPGNALEAFVNTFALLPLNIISGLGLGPLVTSMFLHGGFAHIIGNMLFLHIFGDNLEDAMGHLKYLAFYLLTGFAASFAQIAIDPLSTIPNLGASGAIAGLMGGYLLLFPRHRIDLLIPLGLIFTKATLPAFTMLIYWFVFQLFIGVGSLGIQTGGVAYFAHIGGFIAGLILVIPFRGLLLSRSTSHTV